jgi:phage terminase large subunit
MTKIQVTPVFEKNWDANTRIIVNQGGARASKTYSIAQKYIIKLLQETGKTLSIVRKTTPALRISVMRDFLEILVNMDLYDSSNHNKTDKTYTLNGNLVEFFGMDDPQKKRGAKRDYLWLNEANELTLEDWRQLSIRTTGEITLDYNPSDEFHWIYDEVMTRDDCTFIQSTYKDNPFLPQTLIEEIEKYRELDPAYYRVFGLGERGASQSTIYNHWKECEVLPEAYDNICYGIDWGFNHPTAVVEVREKEGEFYVKQLLYQSGLNSYSIIDKLEELGISKTARIIADSAEPDKINDVYRAGFRGVLPTVKGKNSVARGIKAIKGHPLYITSDSVDGIKEIRFYRYMEDKNGNILEDPIKVKDDFCDAMRYAIDYMVESKVSYAKIYSNKPAGF